MGITNNYKFLAVKMVNVKVIILSARAAQMSIDYDPYFFSSFSNINLIVWLNVFFFH